MRRIVVCVLVAVAGVSIGFAEEFALKFQKIRAADVMAFPGGYGTYGQLRLAKPSGLNREPKAVSNRPLYGELRETERGSKGILFRLDESQGEGKGYDRLLMDMNRNGDLTDETAVAPAVLPEEKETENSRVIKPILFGPVEAPESAAVNGGRPVYFAQVYVSRLPSSLSGQQIRNIYAGQLRFKAGWYLETTVELAGVKEKVGVFDGDGNFHLGDTAQQQTYTNQGSSSWYFRPADSFLVDSDGSGAFEGDPFSTEATPIAPVLYLGAKPFHVTLDSSCKSLRVTPWTEDLAEVALQPRGRQVRTVNLAWEHPAGNWQLIEAVAKDGKIQVPAGSYRFYGCALLVNADSKDALMVSASQRSVKRPFKFAANTANRLRCGGPLDVKVTADKRIPQTWEISSKTPAKTDADSDYVLRINGNFVGAGTEIYSSFGTGERFRDDPPKPTFKVADASGKTLGTGNLEFG